MFFHHYWIFPTKCRSHVPGGLPGIGMQLTAGFILGQELEAARERRARSTDKDCNKCKGSFTCNKEEFRW